MRSTGIQYDIANEVGGEKTYSHHPDHLRCHRLRRRCHHHRSQCYEWTRWCTRQRAAAGEPVSIRLWQTIPSRASMKRLNQRLARPPLNRH